MYKPSNKQAWGDFLSCMSYIITTKQVLGLITFLRNIEKLQMMFLKGKILNNMIAGMF